MAVILGFSSTANAGVIGNAGVFYYAVGPAGVPGGYSNVASASITDLAVNVTAWNAVTGLKVNLCNSLGVSQRVAEFLPADGTGLILKAVTPLAYTGGAAMYLEILTTGGTGFVDSYRSTGSFECKSCLTGTYASPGNIAPGSDSDIPTQEGFVYANGTFSGGSAFRGLLLMGVG